MAKRKYRYLGANSRVRLTDIVQKRYFFSIKMSYLDCQNLYQPGINSVMLRADSGQRVQIPVSNLRPFVTSTGIVGRFRLTIDENNKLIAFDKMI